MMGGRASVEVAPPIIEPDKRPVTIAPRLLKQRLVVADVFVVALAISMAFVWQWLLQPANHLGVQRSHLVLAFITFPAWIVSFSLHKLYQARAVERPTEELRRIVYATLTAIGLIVAVSF